MPKTKLEGFIFTVIMTFIMVYAMVCYNIAMSLGGMKDQVFLMALGEMRIMWPVSIILEMLVMEKPVMALTKRVVGESTSFSLTLLVRSAITVSLMCPAMSFVATLLFKDFSSAGLISTWLQTSLFNFPMALAWQIFYAGPLCRLIFRTFFRREKKVSAGNAETEL